MKLRIRHGKTTDRLEVPDNVTYGDLKEQLARLTGSTPSSFRLSLNKQVELCQGELGTCIKAEGVQGGDLLWVLPDPVTGALPTTTTSTNGSTLLHTLGQRQEPPAAESIQTDAAVPQATATAAPPNTPMAALRPGNGSHTQGRQSGEEDSSEDMQMLSTSARLEPQLQARPAWSLSDYLALVQEANSGDADILLCALHAALLEAGLEPKWLQQVETGGKASKFVLPSYKTRILRLEYRYAHQDKIVDCQVALSWLGQFVIISAKLPEGTPHSLSLEGNAYKVKEPATEAGKLQVVENEADLWIQLTNSIVRPLIADLRASLGLSPQLGLMSLPMELADRILSQLKEQDLVSLMMTCREMRTLGAADLHWERLAKREFEIFEEDVVCAQQWGWQRLYRSKFLGREAARQQLREMRAQRFRMPSFSPMQSGPFRRPPGPYHQIGGDYDRNPLFQGPTFRPFIGSSGRYF